MCVSNICHGGGNGFGDVAKLAHVMMEELIAYAT
jgi:hypothetical protein